jgi:heme oxygenase
LKNLLSQISAITDENMTDEHKNQIDMLVQTLIDKVKRMLDMVANSKVAGELSDSTGLHQLGGLSLWGQSSLDPREYIGILDELYALVRNLEIKLRTKTDTGEMTDLERRIQDFQPTGGDSSRDDVSQLSMQSWMSAFSLTSLKKEDYQSWLEKWYKYIRELEEKMRGNKLSEMSQRNQQFSERM